MSERIALYMEDRFAFRHALFNAWAEGHTVVLPGDNLPRTLEALRPHVDQYIDTPLSPWGEGQGEGTYAVPSRLEDARLILFTSGSTGEPTPVPKRLKQLFAEVETLEATFGSRIGPDATFFSTVSHQHIYGLLWTVLWPTVTGRPISQRRTEYPEQLEALISATPSVLISSPAHLKRLNDERSWKTQLRAVFSSGGALPPEGAAMSRAVLGHQPIEVYGSTETGGVAWRDDLDAPWKPLSGVTIRASAENTLELKSPHLPDDQWFTTADRIALHDETFTLKGRADRIAKIEEKRVSLDLIERVAKETGLLSEARVITVPGHGQRTLLGLVGVPSPEGRALDRKALLAALKRSFETAIERVAHPRRYRFLDVLPHNEQGKVTEAVLSPLFASDRPEVQWTERTPTHATCTMHIEPTLRVFDGHFPGVPVVAGVAQLDWAVGWATEVFGITGAFNKMEAIKYQRLMTPGHDVRCDLDWNPERKTLTFRFHAPKGAYSSGRVTFAS